MGGGCPVAMRPGVPRGVLRPHTLSACALTPQRGKRGTQIPPRSLKKRGVSFHTQIHAFCHFPNAVGSTRATLASTPGSGSCRGRTRRTAATPAAPTATYDPIRIRSCRFEHDDHLHFILFLFFQNYQGTNCASCDDCGGCGTRTVLGITITEPGWYTLLVEGCKSRLMHA